MNFSDNVIPHQAIHPGSHLREELAVRGIKQNELAVETGILPSQLNEILRGKRPIGPDFAIRSLVLWGELRSSDVEQRSATCC